MQKKIRKLYDKYERYLLIGLVLFVLVIFTVTEDITNWLRSLGSEVHDPTSAAGAFSVLPGDRTEVSWDQFEATRQMLRRTNMVITGANERVDNSDVWTHLVLRAAAKKEGIAVSDSDLREFLKLRFPPEVWNDRARYRELISNNFRTTPRQFEEGMRDFLTALRVREIYRQSFDVAPPATRESMVKDYAGRDEEFARVTWLGLDAEHHLDAAAQELKANADPDKELQEFFTNDAEVKTHPHRFRHRTRYTLEFIVAVHEKIKDPDAYKQVEDLFFRAWPELEEKRKELEPKLEVMRDYYSVYRDRLLELYGTDWATIKKPTDEEDKDEETKDGEEKEGDEEKKEPVEPTEEQKEAWFNRGFDIVRDQVAREIRLRFMFTHIRNEAAKSPKKSLTVLFEHLQKHDDKDSPICSTDPDKGILVLLIPESPVTGLDIDDLAVAGEKATHNVRLRVTRMTNDELPQIVPKAETWGMEEHGRMVFRLINVEQARRKTYDELTGDEKEELKTEFYLPEKARIRARDTLEELRKKCVDGGVTAADLAAKGKDLNARYWQDEWILTSLRRPMTEPSRSLYWPDEFRHMRDRHYLRRGIAAELAADRAKKEIQAGSYLDVLLDSREGAKDPGTAYLVLVLERKKPSADTMPVSQFESFIVQARQQRSARERERWDSDFPALKAAFQMEFFGDMQKQIEDELQAREEARRKNARRN